MKAAFRADASVMIGSGHVMRCLALADVLRVRGLQVLFLCRRLSGHLGEMIRAHGHALVWLPDRIGFDPAVDAEDCAAALGAEAHRDWLVVDHYGLDAVWEHRMRTVAKRIMVIDDLANRPHDCDLLLDQNFCPHADRRYARLVPDACEQMLGPRYALIRPAFGRVRQQLGQRDGSLRKLLICFGGSDPDNLTALAVEAFLAAGMEGVVAEVVVGAGNPHWQALQSRFANLPNVHMQRDVTEMADCMAHADLFLGSGGSMTWERATLGLPGLTLALADNQRQLSLDIAEEAAGLHLGDAGSVQVPDMVEALRTMARQPGLMRAMSRKLMEFTDGLGAERVAARILAPEIVLRPARDADCDRIYHWRNHPLTRRYFFNSSPLDFDTHHAWFGAALQNASCLLLVATQAGADVGVLRYDLAGEEATVSIYLDPDRHGQGLGTALIRSGTLWMQQHHPEVRRVVSEILYGNTASFHAFKKAGFREISYRFQFDMPATGQGQGGRACIS